MAADSCILLRHPCTGKETAGYYGFSGETLRSFGFCLRRGNTRLFLTALTPLIGFVLLPPVLLLFPDARKSFSPLSPALTSPFLCFSS